MKKLLTVLLFVGFAPSAFAATKVYTAEPPHSAGGDRISIRPGLCPTTLVVPGVIKGMYTLDDDGTGTVTLTDALTRRPANVDADTSLALGPGAFLFIDGEASSSPTPGQTGIGSTASTTGSVVWGIISGWTTTGGIFCASSPTTTCNDNGFVHGVTTTPEQTSVTFDLGTWSFDAEGDFEGSPFIVRTTNGGLSNTSLLLRATFMGAGLPALPLVGFGLLAVGLVTVGARATLRKK